jgi:hypothetical protein
MKGAAWFPSHGPHGLRGLDQKNANADAPSKIRRSFRKKPVGVCDGHVEKKEDRLGAQDHDVITPRDNTDG